MISQLLGILVAGLIKHKHSVKDLKVRVTELLSESLGPFGTRNPKYIKHVVAATFAAVIDAKGDLPLRVSVLKIASPPLVNVRKELTGVAPIDSESSSPAESASARSSVSAEAGTSVAPDAQSEQI